jgi:hypothetical protein
MMSIQIDWYNESEQIISCKIEGEIQSNEIHLAQQAIEDFT